MKRAHVKQVPTLVAMALLAACGGGEGYSGMVRPDPPAPPPPTANAQPCEGPQASDCIVDTQADPDASLMTGDRTSDHALIKRGFGNLTLDIGDFRFAGGTAVEAGQLTLNPGATLISNVSTAGDTAFVQLGDVVGNADLSGSAYLGGTITGNVTNRGNLRADPMAESTQLIDGNYVQDATGVLEVAINLPEGGFLAVTGTASLDGSVAFYEAFDWDYAPFPMPDAPFSNHLLHADGGVSGAFTGFTSPGLFITGVFRYEDTDVFFDAQSASAEAAMSRVRAGDALTHAGARRFDQALTASQALIAQAHAGGLTQTQRDFLRSAAAIQRIGDYAQAIRTFDSLSGHGHAAAIDAHMTQALRAAPMIGTHVNDLAPNASGAWAARPATFAAPDGAFNEQGTFGYDVRLADNLVAGSSVGQVQGTLDLARGGGTVRSDAPQWNLYLRRDGQRGYATGIVGVSRQRMQMHRPIDLDRLGTHDAFSERDYDTTFGYVEGGRAFAFGGGRITPYAAMHYTRLQAGPFAEQGDTGFELAGTASTHERFGGDVGVRYGRQWSWMSGHWVRVDLGGRQRQWFGVGDTASAAFVGAPSMVFDLSGAPLERMQPAWTVDLVGGRDQRWGWSLHYEGMQEASALSLAFVRGF